MRGTADVPDHPFLHLRRRAGRRGLGVILARNPVHCALLLVLCFFNSAVIWLLLDAEFLGIVLVLVYVGAVMVLFLFVVMMLDVNLEKLRKEFVGYWPLAVAVAGFVVFAIINVIVVQAFGRRGLEDRAGDCRRIIPIPATSARQLFTRYAYPAQIAARDPVGGERRGHRPDACGNARAASRRTSPPKSRCAPRTGCGSSKWPPRRDP